MKISKGVWLCTGLLLSAGTQAGVAELNAAADQLCEKSKMCVRQQIAATDDLPAGMAAMVDNMINEMCGQFNIMVTEAKKGEYSDLIEPATACLNSLSAQSCDGLLNSESETAACEAYNKAAEKHWQN